VLDRVLLLVVVALIVAVAVLVVRTVVAGRTRARLGRPLPEALRLVRPGVPTVLYFYGAACAACAQQERALTSLPSERLNVVAVDAARQTELAEWAGVLTVPSTAIVDPQRRLRTVNHGFRPADDLAAQLASIA
jgi:peroxiredoxin